MTYTLIILTETATKGLMGFFAVLCGLKQVNLCGPCGSSTLVY